MRNWRKKRLFVLIQGNLIVTIMFVMFRCLLKNADLVEKRLLSNNFINKYSKILLSRNNKKYFTKIIKEQLISFEHVD
ncbi:hypothetical protein BpHYR1_003499 [Brachionus plicatilis]|uniref:Uncharacterized protein n=1 Tax=Brachionus plicatilis TaxID=10195 RepID=A0A3M7PXG2_BRAPC|nr:hypothetical protein BpHYR1_003499 [Brachionus plicatilis]